MNSRPAVLGFAGFSGSGKTTLLARVIPLLNAAGVRVGVIKHAHHTFDIDHQGKDSYVLRKSGAAQILIASHHRWAWIAERDPARAPALNELLERFDSATLDLILVEGFKLESIPKVEVHRPALHHPLLVSRDPTVVAVATDTAPCGPVAVPVLNLNDPGQIADFVCAFRCTVQSS